MSRGDNRWVTARLDEKGWLYRALQVATPEGTYRVTYNGRGLGYESVSVNGELAASRASTLWYVPEFYFPVGSMYALVKVRVWPWLSLRSFELIINGESVYSE